MEDFIDDSEEMKNIDDAEVMEGVENVFLIKDDLELVYNHGLFNLMSEDGYVVFRDVNEIEKKDDNYFSIVQDDTAIYLNAEEYDMICKAVDVCKGVK